MQVASSLTQPQTVVTFKSALLLQGKLHKSREAPHASSITQAQSLAGRADRSYLVNVYTLESSLVYTCSLCLCVRFLERHLRLVHAHVPSHATWCSTPTPSRQPSISSKRESMRLAAALLWQPKTFTLPASVHDEKPAAVPSAPTASTVILVLLLCVYILLLSRHGSSMQPVC